MATAISYRELGGPEVLTLTEIEVPPPGPGEVAVRVEAVGVNPIDHKLRSGKRPSPEITAPRRVGSDGAGVVTAVGAEVDGYRVGDAVVVFGATGVYASDIVVTPARLTPRPPQVSAAQGAALMTDTKIDTIRVLGSGWAGHFNRPIAEAMYQNIQKVGLPTWDEKEQTLARGIQRELGVNATGLASRVGQQLRRDREGNQARQQREAQDPADRGRVHGCTVAHGRRPAGPLSSPRGPGPGPAADLDLPGPRRDRRRRAAGRRPRAALRPRRARGEALPPTPHPCRRRALRGWRARRDWSWL